SIVVSADHGAELSGGDGDWPLSVDKQTPQVRATARSLIAQPGSEKARCPIALMMPMRRGGRRPAFAAWSYAGLCYPMALPTDFPIVGSSSPALKLLSRRMGTRVPSEHCRSTSPVRGTSGVGRELVEARRHLSHLPALVFGYE